VVYVIIYDQI